MTNPLQAMQDEIAKHNALAMSGLHESQRNLGPGSYWVQFVDLDMHPPLVIFGHCWGRSDYHLDAAKHGTRFTEDEFEEIERGCTESGLMMGFAFSHVEPDGGLGYTHKANVWPIEDRLYDAAYGAGGNVNQLNPEGRALLEIAYSQFRTHYLALRSAEKGLPNRGEIRKVITDAYYEARNQGRTMEQAADEAADQVLILLAAKVHQASVQ